jgi:predicted transcriptional regulator
MQRNQRKLQILEILAEKPLTVEETADVANTGEHNALVYCLRYQEQGLLQKVETKPTTFCITDRGIGRLEFLLSER